MDIEHLKGLVAPVFTPMNTDCSINYAVIPDYLQMLSRMNIRKNLVNGTTGEGMSLGLEERRRVGGCWVAAARPLGIRVMVQVGGAALPDVLELARHAEDIGADSILCLPELYFRPSNAGELVSYLSLVSEAAPSLPILYYHFPMQSGVHINVQEFAVAAVNRIPNFCGIKCNLSEGAEIIFSDMKDIAVFLGNTAVLAPGIISGFDSTIATLVNILPALCSDIVVAAKNGDVQKAKNLQIRLNTFTDIVTSEVVPTGHHVSAVHAGTVPRRLGPAMKASMELVTGLRVGPPRPPLAALNAQRTGHLRERLAAERFLP